MIKQFLDIMNAPPFDQLGGVSDLAVAVSGGPDSMALAHMLCSWAKEKDGMVIHIITVDHGLRPESAKEAQMVADAVKDWPKAKHVTLVWEGEKPEARIQEEAREARYRLIKGYCNEHAIQNLLLAHHGDDQVETFLFRLSKGSGLDGLCGMRAIQPRGNLTLYRPLLSFSKQELVTYCQQNAIYYVEDPSNNKDEFARIRLRKMISALEEEGLSFKRLDKTTQRLERARQSLDKIADSIYLKSNIKTSRIEFDFECVVSCDEEIVLRVFKKALDHLVPTDGYGPRTEKLESLVCDFMSETTFRKRTLGGVIFEISKDGTHLILEKEDKSL